MKFDESKLISRYTNTTDTGVYSGLKPVAFNNKKQKN